MVNSKVQSRRSNPNMRAIRSAHICSRNSAEPSLSVLQMSGIPEALDPTTPLPFRKSFGRKQGSASEDRGSDIGS